MLLRLVLLHNPPNKLRENIQAPLLDDAFLDHQNTKLLVSLWQS